MGLRFPGAWRFTPPADGHFLNASIPELLVWELREAIDKIAGQGDRWAVLEHFKSYFGVSSKSSSESWADSDLQSAMKTCANNAPIFIEAFISGCDALRDHPNRSYAPDAGFLNSLLVKHNVGYVIQNQDLVAREIGGKSIPVLVAVPTMAEVTKTVIETSLERSEELLSEDRPREAVQEILWLLETVATAFRGMETESGKVEGKYFNHIIRDLRKQNPGTTLERVLDWITTMHGYLSSPKGGGVRHGIDLREGVSLDRHEARLFCNLARSYIQFLLKEYESLVKP